MATTLVYTAGDLCTEALRDAHVVGVDRAADAEEMDVAIKRLNMMLKRWQNSAITVWKQTTGSITITNATASYVITARPLTLNTVTKKDAAGLEAWMQTMSRQEYYELTDKDSAGEPSQFYYHREQSQGTLYVWPVMATGVGTIEWSGRNEIADVVETTDALEVPGEWWEAVLYGLALRLSNAFGSDAPLLPALAMSAYADAAGGEATESMYFEPDHG